MNLTPPPPSQNSHAVRWHCTAESKRRVAEIKSFVRLQLAARVAQFVRGIRTLVDRNAHMRVRLYCVLRVETL